jgi:nitronate monooxygenase
MEEVEAQSGAILPFPLQNSATRPMRNAAAAAGDARYLSLWAGQGAPLARETTAAELVATLVREAADVRERIVGS